MKNSLLKNVNDAILNNGGPCMETLAQNSFLIGELHISLKLMN